MRDQYTILQDIQAKGYNVVTCGECGYVLLHDIKQEEIECPYCHYTSDPCDFPDLFYQGWEGGKKNEKIQV